MKYISLLLFLVISVYAGCLPQNQTVIVNNTLVYVSDDVTVVREPYHQNSNADILILQDIGKGTVQHDIRSISNTIHVLHVIIDDMKLYMLRHV
ncbi:Hypothetical protein ORPV_131 [Orpheovirus IHUMI-LCC2]|uniref:Uncharacterized protein n=1 Tax=Orpheovirus IHUMI-LCC2 TaxID=2023057 RepID=A0A2I2L3B0_9VIRU|nr:Hypothetical protein ORPV_131 [Orpheovirus IHUMI-LCC2]SNW62035.1 Hypothetical protein ORPV_131 [Orpheovirus IHUMI-LCC2]